tara:strand:- start:590 stop:958 length:369 start_codon:yes stop_codon:yes gene_type:complete
MLFAQAALVNKAPAYYLEQGTFSMTSIKVSIMNQPVREALPTPAGWLVAPTKDFCLFFIRDPKSVMVAPSVLTQLWYSTKEGIPTKLKNTRRLDYESAHETWNELLSHKWQLIEHQINDAVA